MRVSLVSPAPNDGRRFIREGRCMQSVDSWATSWPPLTLAVLASLARERGEVDLFDGNVEPGHDLEATVERVRGFAPDLVVVNTGFPSIESDASCAGAIKRACPAALVVGFGVFFTLLDERAMEACPGFDLGITGEPEETFAELLDAVARGERPAEIAGLMWREEATVRRGPPRAPLEDLDRLPFAARDLLRNDRYRLPHNGRPFTLINVARGCPYPCIYCVAPAYYGKRVRRHSLDYLLEEIALCRDGLGISQVLFWEEVFTLDRDFVLALCQALRRRAPGLKWAATTRADLVDEELLRAMKGAGCELLGLGIETADQRILDGAEKRQSVETVRAAVSLCRRVGIATMGHFIFGLPGETPETIERSIRHGLELGLDFVQCYPAVPYPKTRLHEIAVERGWITSERWSEYDFGGRSILRTDSLSPDEVDRARARMFRRFYLRPTYLIRQVLRLARRPRQLLQASRFLEWIKPEDRRKK